MWESGQWNLQLELQCPSWRKRLWVHGVGAGGFGGLFFAGQYLMYSAFMPGMTYRSIHFIIRGTIASAAGLAFFRGKRRSG